MFVETMEPALSDHPVHPFDTASHPRDRTSDAATVSRDFEWDHVAFESPRGPGVPRRHVERDDPIRRAGRVLIVASRFPPVASVGATRIRKFVKYLGDFGWQATVLTGPLPELREKSSDSVNAGSSSVDRNYDAEGLNDIPPYVHVHRLPRTRLQSPSMARRAGAQALGALTRRLGLDESWWNARLGWRIESLVERCSVPDGGILGLPVALAAALRLHRRFRFDVLYSSGMPFSDHLIALCVRRLIARPWIAEFRDPWVEYAHWDQWRGGKSRRFVHLAEAAVIRNASRVAGVNDTMSRRFGERYADMDPRKFITLENGFDPEDFPRDVRPESRKTHFRVVYAGSLYGLRRPDAILAAMRKFIEATPGSGRHVRLEFFGRPGPYAQQLREFDIPGIVHDRGRVSHACALSALAGADLNVVILPRFPGGEADTTAKVYECLGSGRPILAAVPLDGEAAHLLRGFDGVSLCESDDVPAIAAAVAHWYARWLANDLNPNRSAPSLAALTRRRQTQRLAEALDQLTPHRRPGSRGQLP